MEIEQKPKLRLRRRKHLTGLALAAYREAFRKEIEPPVGAEPQPIRLRGTYEEARPTFVELGPGVFKLIR